MSIHNVSLVIEIIELTKKNRVIQNLPNSYSEFLCISTPDYKQVIDKFINRSLINRHKILSAQSECTVYTV